jgi:6,7-dimethyl-8-ribityllumazine synthase
MRRDCNRLDFVCHRGETHKMSRILEGRLRGKGRKIGIVCGRFNELITKQLLSGCEQELVRHDVESDDIVVAWVPGAFEIPLLATRMARSGTFDAVICLGAVIRGATPHFDYVAGESAKGVAAAARDADLPVIFGILTVDTIEQALERAGTKAGNKGRDAAWAAMEMIDLIAQVESVCKHGSES